MITLRQTLLIPAALLCLLAPSAARAQCDSDVLIETSTGSNLFGLRSDGARLGTGQSFMIDCRARFDTARAQLSIREGVVTNGVRQLGATDEVTATLMNANLEVLATVTVPVGFDDGTQWIDFDFVGQNIVIEEGTYVVGFTTDADAAASYPWSVTGNDIYPDGSRVTDWGGAWVIGNSNIGDVAFQATWNSRVVSARSEGWSAVKSAYH